MAPLLQVKFMAFKHPTKFMAFKHPTKFMAFKHPTKFMAFKHPTAHESETNAPLEAPGIQGHAPVTPRCKG
jgi:hypothetical protein